MNKNIADTGDNRLASLVLARAAQMEEDNREAQNKDLADAIDRLRRLALKWTIPHGRAS